MDYATRYVTRNVAYYYYYCKTVQKSHWKRQLRKSSGDATFCRVTAAMAQFLWNTDL